MFKIIAKFHFNYCTNLREIIISYFPWNYQKTNGLLIILEKQQLLEICRDPCCFIIEKN